MGENGLFLMSEKGHARNQESIGIGFYFLCFPIFKDCDLKKKKVKI